MYIDLAAVIKDCKDSMTGEVYKTNLSFKGAWKTPYWIYLFLCQNTFRRLKDVIGRFSYEIRISDRMENLFGRL